MSRLFTVTLVGLIRAYQIILSPLVGARCRFAPSCSHYAAEAISTHGPRRGLWFALKRIARCHPWGGAGFDPVPPRASITPPLNQYSRCPEPK